MAINAVQHVDVRGVMPPMGAECLEELTVQFGIKLPFRGGQIDVQKSERDALKGPARADSTPYPIGNRQPP